MQRTGLLICSNCATENEAARKFCIECGALLASGCRNCGAHNPAEAKFCGSCGTPLRTGPGVAASSTSAGSPLTASAAERRLVTVLFADLVGFTSQQEGQDPEDTREFLTRYFDLTRTIVERYGGTVEKFIGDAVMAVWGAPTAHEDDAERAVRAALDIVDAVPSLADQLDVQVRAGVLTGEAAVTIGASGQGMVAGDLVNTASRLQSVAPPGTVLVGEATYRATSGAIQFERAGEQLLKGKPSPEAAWRATAVVALRRGSGRSEALEPPFTGRDEELRLVKDLFHATERERKARLVSIIGQAGIGKSRLAWEFEKYIDGVVGTVYWHYGRSPAYGEGISYWALAEMVRGRARIAENEEPATSRRLLRDAVAEWVADDADRRWIEPRLAALLALEQMPPGSRDELFAAWRRFFEQIAERGPTVLAFEDVQWADDGMLEFIEELLDRSRNQPIFVMTLARPELHERRPTFGASLRSVTAMNLEPLDDEQTAQLVRGTVPGIDEQAVAAIVERTEGIPLYAVETIRMLIDRGQLVATADGRYAMTAALGSLAVPETLHALIAARLDALDERDRRLLQTAAVVGQSFTGEALSAVQGEPLNDLSGHLAVLVRRQLLSVEVDPRSPERGHYQFVQEVVREVAERSLSRADRRALHVAAARYYESLGDDELAGVLASHYAAAYRATPPGPEAEALAAQARVSLRGAAERATALHSHAQALAYVEQALAVTVDPVEQVPLHERAADSALRVTSVDVALEHARSVEQLSRQAGDRLGVLRGMRLQASVHLAEHGERPAIALLRPALQEVEDLGPSQDVAYAQAELARALMLQSTPEPLAESVTWCNRVLDAPDVATDEQLLEVLVTKGTALIPLGKLREAEAVLRGAIHVADGLGLVSTAARGRNNLLSLVELDDLAAALGLLEEGFASARQFGLRGWELQFGHVALLDSFYLGEWDTWVDETAQLEPTGFYLGWRSDALGHRAAFRGDLEGARRARLEAAELIGAGSSQAAAGIGLSEAIWNVAACNWPAVLPTARVGYGHYDSTMRSVGWQIVAGIAMADSEVIAEGRGQLTPDTWRGRFPDALRAYADAGMALAESRWPEARARYLAAAQALGNAGGHLWLALLNLAVATLAAGRFPEAAEAAAAAAEFFRTRGAETFVERYPASVANGPARVASTTPQNVPSTPSVARSRD